MLEGNDIPYEGCNAIGPAKRQRNSLRDYFMNERQLPGQQLKCEILLYCDSQNVNRIFKHF